VRILLTWIGKRDPWRPKEGRRSGTTEVMPRDCPKNYLDGPILTFLARSDSFDAIYILYDPPLEKNNALSSLQIQLAERFPLLKVFPRFIPIDDPVSYEPLYRYMRASCEEVQAHHGNKAEYHLLLGPGTPQMHTVWVLLAKTVFTSHLWQIYEFNGELLTKAVTIPFDIDADIIGPIVRTLKNEPLFPAGDFVFTDISMKEMLSIVSRVAPYDHPVLLLGESGVGKGKVARLLHDLGPRKNHPFTNVDCAAIMPSLIESELFGHVLGAFTGAVANRPGFFEAAQGGTIFLDEIGELGLDLQSKLLKVVEEKRLRRVGSSEEIPCDVRVVAATKRRIKDMVDAGEFREDLYWRLAVVPITVPPLRERPGDIQVLSDYFLTEVNNKRVSLGEPPLKLGPSARRWLEDQSWPGNVRELKNAIERIGLFASRPIVDKKEVEGIVNIHGSNERFNFSGMALKEALDTLERKMIEDALSQHKTQKAAAKALGLGSQQALQRRMVKWRNVGK
jgi:transcriptional regulator with AAA-type ATPase domain